jgi:hypothetical protein
MGICRRVTAALPWYAAPSANSRSPSREGCARACEDPRRGSLRCGTLVLGASRVKPQAGHLPMPVLRGPASSAARARAGNPRRRSSAQTPRAQRMRGARPQGRTSAAERRRLPTSTRTVGTPAASPLMNGHSSRQRSRERATNDAQRARRHHSGTWCIPETNPLRNCIQGARRFASVLAYAPP